MHVWESSIRESPALLCILTLGAMLPPTAEAAAAPWHRWQASASCSSYSLLCTIINWCWSGGKACQRRLPTGCSLAHSALPPPTSWEPNCPVGAVPVCPWCPPTALSTSCSVLLWPSLSAATESVALSHQGWPLATQRLLQQRMLLLAQLL